MVNWIVRTTHNMTIEFWCIFESEPSQVSWKEFVIENATSVSGKVRRIDKSFIMLYHSPHLRFRITARHHDQSFKYYLDCHQAQIYEQFVGIPGKSSKSKIKKKAVMIIESSLKRNALEAFVELNKIRNSLNETRTSRTRLNQRN